MFTAYRGISTPYSLEPLHNNCYQTATKLSTNFLMASNSSKFNVEVM